MMVEIPDVLTPEEAKRCRELLDGAGWRDGRETAGDLARKVKTNLQLAQDDRIGQQIGDVILERLGGSERFMAAALPLKVLPPRFNRYEGGGAYGDHVDNAVFSAPGTPIRIRGDLSATLFLTDPEDYEGGALVVEGPSGSRRVKLPAGHMALYSSGAVHRVEPVTRGARLAAFFWVQSLVRQENRRAMLLELDDTIRALRAETPDNAAAVRLTALYHNLLRDWADT